MGATCSKSDDVVEASLARLSAIVEREDCDEASPKLPVELAPHLLLGNKQCASDVRHLRSLGVTHVLNMAGANGEQSSECVAEYLAAGIQILRRDALDVEAYPLLWQDFQTAHEYIEGARAAGGRCLVHCMHGINRAGFTATASYMLHTRSTLFAAAEYCRRRRGESFLFNESFQRQLIHLARTEGLLADPPLDVEATPETLLQAELVPAAPVAC